MLAESVDLIAEAETLHDFLLTLEDADWARPTPFQGWTPWDVVAHLHFFDRVSLLALSDPAAFGEKRKVLIEDMAAGVPFAVQQRRELGALAHAELRDTWLRDCRAMAQQLGESDPSRRLPWFGPDMGVRMFTTARLMETWAHGQDVYDLVRASREHTDRIRHIAELGVRTFGWTFANRGLPAPGDPPHVQLRAPSGADWAWNEENEADRVSGSALEFCQVVTQGRNVADTGLEVSGPVAEAWMAIAQCFAGAPADPPAPGERDWSPGEGAVAR